MVYDILTKKCPFNGETAGIGARAYTECTKKDCRFQVAGNRCSILESHETLARLEQKLDSIMRQVGAR